jgi:hypothetical protein
MTGDELAAVVDRETAAPPPKGRWRPRQIEQLLYPNFVEFGYSGRVRGCASILELLAGTPPTGHVGVRVRADPRGHRRRPADRFTRRPGRRSAPHQGAQNPPDRDLVRSARYVPPCPRSQHFRHPVVGELALAFDAMELPADNGLTLTAYSAERGSPAEKLARLASWSAPAERMQPDSLPHGRTAHGCALCALGERAETPRTHAPRRERRRRTPGAS